MRFFFYGTLLDPEVRRALGIATSRPWLFSPAHLPGHVRRLSHAGNYPVVARAGRGRVPGLLAERLERREALTIAYFEGPRFRLEQRLVVDCRGRRRSAWLFVPCRPGEASSQAWHFGRWQVRGKRPLLASIARWMGEIGARRLETHEIPWAVRRTIDRSFERGAGADGAL